jgi:5-methylcytosine-specific restriction endonuclease McrA
MENKDAYDFLPATAFLPSEKRKQKMRQWVRDERIPWKDRYHGYLRSALWSQRRKQLFRKRGKICERCGKAKEHLHIHHLSYVRLGCEDDEDLKILCESCHILMHPRKRSCT